MEGSHGRRLILESDYLLRSVRCVHLVHVTSPTEIIKISRTVFEFELKHNHAQWQMQ